MTKLYMMDSIVSLQATIDAREKYYSENNVSDVWPDSIPVFESNNGVEIIKLNGMVIDSSVSRNQKLKCAEVVTRAGGRILSIGYGLGIIDNEIERYRSSRGVSDHYVVELNKVIANRARDVPNLKVLDGDWRDVLPILDQQGLSFDGIVYEGNPMSFEDIHRDGVVFIEELLSTGLLKDGGVLTFFVDAIGSIGDAFQDYLLSQNLILEELHKIKIDVPEFERENWGVDEMLVPLVRKTS